MFRIFICQIGPKKTEFFELAALVMITFLFTFNANNSHFEKNLSIFLETCNGNQEFDRVNVSNSKNLSTFINLLVGTKPGHLLVYKV